MVQPAMPQSKSLEPNPESFADRVSEIINTGAISAMLSIGHRCRLFDAMAALPPASSTEIADAAGLSERYVREWLAVMVMAGIIRYDPALHHYTLPPEHAAHLSTGGTENLAVYAQAVTMIGATQERLLQCFHSGEGMRYEDYPDFHQFMCEDSAQTVTTHLLDTILPLATGLVQRLEQGIEVLDAGCGRGAALLTLARHFPRSHFHGYDFCQQAVDYARQAALAAGTENLYFDVRDLTYFDETARYDLICSFDAVHDQRDPQDLLRRIYRALRPDGVYLMQDIGGSAHLENNYDFPMAAFLYAISCAHCMPVSLGQGGRGLGTMWGWETARNMLERAGFERIQRNVLDHDPMNVWFVAGKSSDA